MSKTISFSKEQKFIMQMMFAWIAWMLLSLNANAQYVNIPVTGFNNDIVANGVGTSNTTSTGTIPGVSYPAIGVDGGGFSFIDGTYQYHPASIIPPCSLPAGGAIPSALTSGLTYQLQSYSSNNALTIASNTYAGSVHPTSGTVSLVTPSSYGNMYVLYESVMNTTISPPTVTATVTFTDGTNQVISLISTSNWFTNVGRAYASPISRANNAAPGNPDVTCTPTVGPYLFQMTLAISPANYSKQVQSISFNWSSAVGSSVNTVEYLHVLAVGGMAPCVAPVAQPTSLALTSTAPSQINGSFTAPASAPSGYLVVRYPSGAAVTSPSNGTTYTVGQIVGLPTGLGTVISVGSSTSFISTGLTSNTTYDFYVYAYNNTSCIGGSTYNVTTVPGENSGSKNTIGCGNMPSIITVGPTGAYPTLSGPGGALAAISSNGISAPTVIELQNNYVAGSNETYPITISYNTCFTSTNTLTIRPETSTTTARIISSADTTATIDLNGAQYVTIDGRPGGLASSDKFIVIENTRSVSLSSGNAILLRNDASFNTLKYLDVRAANGNVPSTGSLSARGAVPGAIAVTITNRTFGNDNNLIANCDIHSVSPTSTLNVGIYAGNNFGAGSPQNNDSLTITNCNIYDYFHPGSASVGVNVAVGCNNFSITNNHLYQTVARTITGTQVVRAMWISPNITTTPVDSASGFIISGNYIGGSGPNASGSAYKLLGSGFYQFYAMDLNLGVGAVSSIQNNTITNLDVSGSFSANTVRMIEISNGNVNVGTLTGNLIGSTTLNGAVKGTTSANSNPNVFSGFRYAGRDTINFSNNTISGIDIYSSLSNIATGFTMISASGGSNITIENNAIGSSLLVNSISAVSASGSATVAFASRGILVNSSTANATCTIKNNTITNINSNNSAGGGAASSLIGIAVTSTSCSVTGNIISNLTSAGRTSTGGGTCALMGIAFSSPTAPATISGNTVSSLKLTNDTTVLGIQVCGIYYTTSGSSNLIERNFIHSLSIASPTNSTGTITGINLDGGQASVQNNMVRLGLNDAGASIISPCTITGIRKGSSIANLWFNSIYIGGTNVGSTATNTFALARISNAADDIRNNIFVNNRSNASTGGKHYALNLNSTATLTLDYNDYFGSGNGYKFAVVGPTDYTNFTSNWITGDANSYALDPAFKNPNGTASNVDLHIDNSTASIVESTGIAIATVSNDIDNETRAGLTPTDMGADAGNFLGMVCNGTPTGGTTSITQPGPLCVSGTKTLTLSGFSNLPGVTCQWKESATQGGPYTNVSGGSGANTAIYTSAAITSSTYYVCEVTCSNGGASSLSTESLVVVNNPAVTQVVPNFRCGAGTVDLEATATTGATLNWYTVATAGTIADTGNIFTTPVITATTNYWVSAIIGTCESPRTLVTATVNQSPSIAPTATLPLVCYGNSTEVSVSSANDPNYDYTWTNSSTGSTFNGPGPHVVTPALTGTTYKVYAFDTTTQCGRLDSIVVNTTPNNLFANATATPYSVCYGQDAQMNVNAGVSQNITKYTFGASSGTYSPLTGATASSLANAAEFGYSIPFQIGFPFSFGGTVYDSVQVTPMGQLLFGSGKTGSVANNLATATSTLRPGVAPLWDGNECTSGVKYQVSGSVGNRVLTVEWLEMKWSTSASTPVISFQVKLYEGSNVVQFVYRQESASVVNGSASIGIMGTAATDFISLQNSSSSPTISTTTSQNLIGLKPATGQVYTFTPPASGVLTYAWTGSNLSSNTIKNPVALSMSADEIYSVTITDQNNGCTISDTAGVVVHQYPVPSLSSNSDAVCENNQLILSAYDGDTYVWTGPNGFYTTTTGDPINGSSQSIYNMQEVKEGDYTVVVTNAGGCSTSEIRFITVNDRPEMFISTMTPVTCNGNSDNGAFEIGVNGGTPPFNFSESMTSMTNGDGIFSGLSDGTYNVTVTDDATPSCASVIPLTINLTTTPNVAPSIITAASAITVECDGIGNTTDLNNWLADHGGATASDACTPSLTWSDNYTSLTSSCGSTGTVTVIFTATDDDPISPLSVSTTATFTIEDTTSPTITAAAVDQTVECDGAGNTAALNAWLSGNGGATASDMCSNVTWSNNFTSLSDACGATGLAIVTFTATDDCGNASTTTATFTIVDTFAPTITAASGATVQCDGSGNTTAFNAWLSGNGGATASDICSGVTWSNNYTALSDLCGATGSATVTFTATDACGNASSSTATFTIVDTTPPAIVCPANISVNTDPNQCTAVVNFVATASDDCSGSASVSYSIAPGAAFVMGTTTVTATAVDACGNSSSCSFTVSVADNQAPVFNCPANIVVNNTPGMCGAIVNYATPTATDNCVITVTQSNGLGSGQVFPIGTTVNTFVVTDATGNSTSCSFSVIVTDSQFPVINNMPVSFSSCNPISWIPPTASDNCTGVVLTSNYNPGFTFPLGTTAVTYTATDAYNHQTVMSFNVTVLPPPVAADSITSNRLYHNICRGENITLTINGGTLGNLGQWRWYAGGCGTGGVVGTGQSITVSPLNTTTYYVRSEASCGNTGCVSITVVVSTNRPTALWPSYTVIPPYGAPGTTAPIAVAPVNGATYYRWSTFGFYNGSMLFNNQTPPVNTAAPTADITFTIGRILYPVMVYAGNACGRTLLPALTIIRGTVAAPTSMTGPAQVCPGTSHVYTVATIPGTYGLPVTYQWTLIPANAGTISGSGQTRTVTFAPGFTSAQLCVNGVYLGQPGPAYCISISTASPAPAAVNGPATPCQGSTGNAYTITAVPGAIGYIWSTNITGAVITGSGTSVMVSFPNTAFSGNICVKSQNTCGLSTPTCMAVTSGSPGNPGVILGPQQGVCNASNVNYSLSIGGANSYSWTLPTGVTPVGATNLSSINLNFGAGFTSGTISVLASYGCGTASKSILVSGVPAAPGITPAVICSTQTDVIYTASATSATTYNWIFTGATTGGVCEDVPTCSQYLVNAWAVNGSMSVTATNSCGTSAPTNLFTNCRVADNNTLETIVYPNPTHGKVTVEFNSGTEGQFNITVTDLSGRVVMNHDYKAVSGLNRQEVDLGFVNAGLYLIHLKDADGNTSIHKIAVE